MENISSLRGGAVSLTRLIAAVVAALALALALAGSASAKTVYDYVYSGTYFDGTDTAQPFTSNIGGLVYDASQERFFVSVGGSPGYVGKFTKAGNASVFTGLSSPLTMPTEHTGWGTAPDIAVNQTGGPNDGNFYITGRTQPWLSQFTPNGKPSVSLNTTIGIGLGLNITWNCGVAVDSEGIIWSPTQLGFQKFKSDGELIHPESGFQEYWTPYKRSKQANYRELGYGNPCHMAFNSKGEIYVISSGLYGLGGNPQPVRVLRDDEGKSAAVEGGLSSLNGYEETYVLTTTPSEAIAVDPANEDVFVIENGGFTQYDENGAKLGGKWGGPEGPYEGITGSRGLTVDPATHDVWVANKREYAGGIRRVEKFERTNPTIVPGTNVDPVELNDPTGATAVLKGVVDPDGMTTKDCHFEYGLTAELGSSIPCAEGQELSGETTVSAEIPVTKTERYYYKLSAKNSNGRVSLSESKDFIAQGKPKLAPVVSVDRVLTDGVRMNADVDPNGGNTTYRWEWGLVGGFEKSSSEPPPFGFNRSEYDGGFHELHTLVTGLLPGHNYQYRVIATNEAGSVTGPTQEFRTYVKDSGTDACPNVHVRQQTEASLLPDCRAYELVSAANQGGYDVISDIIPGKHPLPSFPRAQDRLLYSVDFGLLPGIGGSPTNLGRDPYLAVRGSSGWSTQYVGLPADGMSDAGAFGSPLYGADPALTRLAFGGTDICDPCFPDGSTNIPLRSPGGAPVKGMAGSLDPGALGNASQTVVKPFSANGTHFVFGSDAKFDGAGDEAGSIYDRNLISNTTQVVSTTPGGAAIAGGEVAELDISSDGSRIVVGKKLGTDGVGNDYYHLYMHIGTNPGQLRPDAGHHDRRPLRGHERRR